MNDLYNDIDELKTLQREAAELKAKRKRSRSRRTTATGQQSKTAEDEEAKPSSQDASIEEPGARSEKIISDLAGHIESVVQDMEAVAIERPVLTIMAAFVFGIIVGKLVSSR
jgi:hypothetical protein